MLNTKEENSISRHIYRQIKLALRKKKKNKARIHFQQADYSL